MKSVRNSPTDSVPHSLNTVSAKPSQNAFLSPSEDISEKTSRELSKFVLTITLNLKRNLRRALEIQERSLSEELILLTERHLKVYLENSLSIDIVAVKLMSLRSEYTSSYLIEDITGKIYFSNNDVLPTISALNFLVQQAFHGSSLDTFLALLQADSASSTLRNALYVEIVLVDTNPASPAKNTFFGDFKWTTPWIVIAAATGIAIFATSFLCFFLLKARSQKEVETSGFKRKIADTPKTLVMQNQFVDDKNSDVQSEQSSDLASVFSYKQQDDTSVSLAPSFLHALSERSALGAFFGTESDDDSMKTPTSFIHQGVYEDDKNSQQQKKPRSVSVPTSKFNINIVSQKCRGGYREKDSENESVQSSTFEEAYDASSYAGDTTVGDETTTACVKSKRGQEFSYLWDDDSLQKADGPTFVDLDYSDDDL
jgi:hypothetical protein